MISKSKNFNINYSAKIINVTEDMFFKHPNPEVERLKGCKVDGFNVITGIDSKPGLYIYFPVECKISPEFLHVNSLYKHSEMNKVHEQSGMFEDSGRVKAINLKGFKSEGFIIPVESLRDFLELSPIANIVENKDINEDFDTIGGKIICEKYVPRNSRTPGAPGSKQGKSPKKKSNVEIEENQFRFHIDTTQLKKCPYVIKPESTISITAKVHGTSGISSNVIIREPNKQGFWSKLFKRPQSYTSRYYSFCTSRKVIKDRLLNGMDGEGWYGGADDKGRQFIHSNIFEPVLDKGMTIYYEIVGYWPHGTPIQGKWDYGFVPDLSESWVHGENFGVEVYRITYTNVDGKVYEFSAKQVQDWCKQHNIPAVEEYYYGKARDLYPDLDESNHWSQNFLERLSEEEAFHMEKKCPRSKNSVPHEGIVVRIDDTLGIDVYKLKCFNFLDKEKKALDKGEVDTETLES